MDFLKFIVSNQKEESMGIQRVTGYLYNKINTCFEIIIGEENTPVSLSF